MFGLEQRGRYCIAWAKLETEAIRIGLGNKFGLAYLHQDISVCLK
jgi:hypothetical protein